MWCIHVPVVEPTAIVVVRIPAPIMVEIVGPRLCVVALNRAAVESAVPCKVTMAPATAFAREAEAPLMVAADPSVGSALHCKVEATQLLLVTQRALKWRISIGPPAMVKMVVPVTRVAAVLVMTFGMWSAMDVLAGRAEPVPRRTASWT